MKLSTVINNLTSSLAKHGDVELSFIYYDKAKSVNIILKDDATHIEPYNGIVQEHEQEHEITEPPFEPDYDNQIAMERIMDRELQNEKICRSVKL